MKKITKYFGYTRLNSTEGGSSRNNAIINELKKSGCEMEIYYSRHILMRIYHALVFIFRCLTWRRENIFTHYSFFSYIFTYKMLCKPFAAKFLSNTLIRRLSERNKLYIEINDLPYEQSIDLELPINNCHIFDSFLYQSCSVHFVFASYAMKQYVMNKYNLSDNQASVLINGGILYRSNNNYKLRPQTDKDRVNFVYAGTLNKGRQIQAMIDLFKAVPQHNLYLLGSDGEWVTNYVVNINNIYYLGSLKENEAHNFISKCDVGLIPYDSTRWYYNICFPSKASFYITAGIPFLSTTLTELYNNFQDLGCAIFCDFDMWANLIYNIKPEYVQQMKYSAQGVAKYYEWTYLINKWLAEAN